MPLRERADVLFRTVYAGPIRAAALRSGLDTTIESTYERLRTGIEWLDYRLAPNPYPLAVGPATVELRLHNRIEYNRAATLVGEREVVADLLAALEPDDVFWDVGGNIGTHTCLAASMLPAGMVVSFEPHPDNATVLATNVNHNGFDHVSIHHVALGAVEGHETLTITGKGSGYGTHSLVGSDGVGTIEVPVKRGDDLIADGLPAPTVLKIDVQGFERDVLAGLTEALLAPTCRVVLVEVHPPRVPVAEIEATLGDAGFETTAFSKPGTGVFRDAVDFVWAEKS